MKGLTEAFVLSKEVFLVVADDVTGDYLVGDISQCADFTVQADNA